MSADYYIFAGFIFLLLIVFVFILKRVVQNDRKRRAQEEDKLSLQLLENEKRLFKLYQNLEDMMDSFESYVNESQREITQLKENAISEIRINAINEPHKEEIIEEEVIDSPFIEEPAKPMASGPKFQLPKGEMVVKLYNEGLSFDQIARELGVAKGEIALILELEGK